MPCAGGLAGRAPPRKRRKGRMRHPASLHPQGVLAVTLATRAVRVGARRDALPQSKPCGARDLHVPHILRRWRREGGARVVAAPKAYVLPADVRCLAWPVSDGGSCRRYSFWARHRRFCNEASGDETDVAGSPARCRPNAGFGGFGAVGPQDRNCKKRALHNPIITKQRPLASSARHTSLGRGSG